MSITAIINTHVYQHQTGNFSIQTILIEGERISSILSSTENLPECTIVDGTNLYLTPGFIDTCSQIGLKELGIRWEGNDGFEPGVYDGSLLHVIDGIYPFDSAFHDAVASGVTAAHIVSGPESVLGAKTSVIHTQGVTVDEMILRSHLGFSFSMGDVPKNAFWEKTRTPLTRMGIAQMIRESLRNLQKEYNLKKLPLFIRSHRADDIATAFRIAKEYNLSIILVHGTEIPIIKNDHFDVPFSVIAGPVFQPVERGELRNLDPSLFYTLFEQQIPFTFATDHPVNSVNHLQLEGSLALKAGVPVKTVINGLTCDAAKLLQVDHLTGSIQPGLLADLVLWNKHPLDLTAKPVRTYIKGKEVYKGSESSVDYI